MDVVQVLEDLKQGVIDNASDTIWYSNFETFADRIDAIKEQYISETNGQLKLSTKPSLYPTPHEVKEYREKHNCGFYTARDTLREQKLYEAVEYLLKNIN